MKNLILATLVVATSLTVNDSFGQSFKDKLKAKAAAAAKAKTKTKASTPTKSGATTAKGSTAKSGRANYHLLEAVRSAKDGTTKTVILEEGDNKGTKVLVIAACESGCMPAMYTFQDEPTATLGKKIYYTTAGIYVMQYDDNSWVSVMPTNELLGQDVFDKFGYSNFYSADASKVKGMTKVKAEAYAIELSKKILAPSTSGPSKGGDGEYHFVIPSNINGTRVTSTKVSFEDGVIKRMTTSQEDFTHMPEFSKIIGVDVYGCTRAWLEQYIYIEKPGELIWVKYKNSGLGKQLSESNDQSNIFAMDKQTARAMFASKSQQDEVDAKIASWTKLIKESEDKRRASETDDKIANQRLPKEGLVVSSLKTQTLAAAKAWATKGNWKETVTKAYLTDADWYIYRHKITGVIVRREIRGVMVMTRPDGMCSFHHCVYGQQYNGSTYNKVYTAGITPGQIKLNCEHAK
jgi:hypothetical protein